MLHPPIPLDEEKRLQALLDTRLLDTAPEDRFDRLTRLAMRVFQVPIALVSLVDSQRQWFKSKQGLDACETSRDISFCGHAIASEAIFEVPDAAADTRFADNPLVTGPPHIRFYAGAPLRTPGGFRIGTLCLIDRAPRSLDNNERAILRELADCVEAEISNQQALGLRALVAAHEARSAAVLRSLPDIVVVLDDTGTFVGCNDHPDLMVPSSEFLGRRVEDILPADVAARCRAALVEALATGEPSGFEYELVVHGSLQYFEARLSKVDATEVLVLIRNVTREHSTRIELARLARLAQETTNGVVVADPEGRIQWVNDGFTRISGYALPQVLGRKPGDVLQGPDTDPGVVEVMRVALRDRQPFEVDLVNYTREGRPYWIRISCSPLFDADGRIEGFMAIESDITASKEIEQRLRDSEHRLVSVIEGTNIGTWEWNVQTGETVFNERWAGIVGYTLDELAPISIETWMALAHPEDLKVSGELLQRHFSGELPYYDCVARMRHKAGHWVWVHDRGRVVSWSDDGKPLLMSGTHADVTEQKAAERSLRESETRLRSLFELSPIGIALNDYDTGQFLDVNDALIRPSGYTRDEFIGLSYWQLTPREYEATEQRQLESLESTGRYGPYEKEYIRKDGSRYPVLLNGVVVTDSSGRRLIWSMIEDISERKRLERIKDEFVSTVSHELRTPLTAISGALGLCAAGVLGELPSKAKQAIDVAHRNSERLGRLINDLLDMDKLMAGQMRFHMRWQPLAALIDQCIADNQAYADRFSVSLRRVGIVPDVEVEVDGGRFQQVLANLLSNAAKFSHAGGSVEVRVDRDGDGIRVDVVDHGQGIPVQFHDLVFEKFSQADASDQRKQGGTGLGLAITRELVQRMGGCIGFQSEPGVGTTFQVKLPCRPVTKVSTGA